jgi:hypothetical protein
MSLARADQPRRLAVLAAALSLAIALMLVVAVTRSEAIATRYASPVGSGTICSQPEPCQLPEALSIATTGQLVEAVGNKGTYGTVTAPLTANLVVPKEVTLEGVPGEAKPIVYTASNAYGIELREDAALVGFAIHESASNGTAVVTGVDSEIDRVLAISETGGAFSGNYGIVIANSAGSGRYGFSDALANGIAVVQLRGDSFFGTEAGAEFSAFNVDMLPELVNSIVLGEQFGIRAEASGGGNVDIDAIDSSYSHPAMEPDTTITPEGTEGNQTAAPLLVDPEHGDFHELAGSPTIDAGLEGAANGPLDLDGNARASASTLTCSGPGTAHTDIGAYEYIAPTPNCNPAPAPVTLAPPTATNPPKPTPSPPAVCKVPKLAGKKLKGARRVLRAHDCALGKVHLKPGATRKHGKVTKQQPKPGTTRPAGGPVAVTLGPR